VKGSVRAEKPLVIGKELVRQFYSKSKDASMRLLSNFSAHSVEYQGVEFPTVEHAFQAQKYRCLLGEHPDLVAAVREAETPAVAKTMGGKAYMKTRQVQLDVEKWGATQIDLMRQLLRSKVDRHPEVAAVLARCKADGSYLVHFERSGNFWGATLKEDGGERVLKGSNVLGNLLMELMEEL
jgi:ribA/ribD-fused uncharacterized protein